MNPGVADPGGRGSGPPVARRSLEVLRRPYARVGDKLVPIGVGGIETADDAWGADHGRGFAVQDIPASLRRAACGPSAHPRG